MTASGYMGHGNGEDYKSYPTVLLKVSIHSCAGDPTQEKGLFEDLDEKVKCREEDRWDVVALMVWCAGLGVRAHALGQLRLRIPDISQLRTTFPCWFTQEHGSQG